MSYYNRKKFKLTWKKIDNGLVQVKLVNKENGDVHIGHGKSIALATDEAYLSTPIRPEFKPKNVLRKKNDL